MPIKVTDESQAVELNNITVDGVTYLFTSMGVF